MKKINKRRAKCGVYQVYGLVYGYSTFQYTHCLHRAHVHGVSEYTFKGQIVNINQFDHTNSGKIVHPWWHTIFKQHRINE